MKYASTINVQKKNYYVIKKESSSTMIIYYLFLFPIFSFFFTFEIKG